MSNLRRPPGPVRQLSLQQPPRRQQVRRQRSAEEEKPLQVFANPIRSRLQCPEVKVDPDRPKVRVAWDENQESVSTGVAARVAVIARQIPGKPRPPTAKTKVTTRPVTSEKASILYSRQELAERLRLAWKQREENRANIDIFLAQNAVDASPDSRPSSCATSIPSTRRRETVHCRTITVNNVAHSTLTKVTTTRRDQQHDEAKVSNGRSSENEKCSTASEVLFKKSEVTTKPVDDESLHEGTNVTPSRLISEDLSGLGTPELEKLVPHSDQEISRIDVPLDQVAENANLREDREQEEIDALEKELRAEEDASVVWTSCPSQMMSKEKKKDQLPQEDIRADNSSSSLTSSAKTKRANFSSHSINSNRVFTSSLLVPLPVYGVVERREKSGMTKDQQSCGLTPPTEGKTRRTNSAPPQQRRQGSSVGGGGRTQVSIVIDTPSIGPALPLHEMKSEIATVATGGADEVVVKAAISNRAIKSAPIKRRTKSGKRRVAIGGGGGGGGGGMKSDGGEEDLQIEGKSRRSGGRGRSLLQTKVPDVVTMVSLVSSADSDSDIDQNSSRDDKLIHELRNKLPTTPIIKTSGGCPAINAVLRKPIKSVSFQQESFDCDREETVKDDRKWGVFGVFGQQKFSVVCRGGGSALPTPEEATSWKCDDATSTSLLTRIESKEPEDALVTLVTDREKRCLAVPIGDPIRDKKRRLLRTRSTPPRPYGPDENPNSPVRSSPEIVSSRTDDHEVTADNKPTTFPGTTNELPTAKADARNSEIAEREQEAGVTSSEPQFQTRKERECWHLYRRMCDKGVYVSFDTVLRGMLTPTEYRLRQKEAAPTDC